MPSTASSSTASTDATPCRTNPGMNYSEGPKRSNVRPMIAEIERLSDVWFDDGVAPESLKHMRSVLSALHAQVRVLHAAGCLQKSQTGVDALPPEQARDWTRLSDECFAILGLIDRVLQSTGSVLQYGEAEEELLLLRVREIVAIVKRHIAEEENLLYRAVWQDVGGES